MLRVDSLSSRLRAFARAIWLATLVLAAPIAAAAVTAGVAVVDSTAQVGHGAGQYAGESSGSELAGTSVGDHGVDPAHLSTRRVPSYGVESRETVRALVVRGADRNGVSKRVAIVANDLYIPQDLLNRRVSGILEQFDVEVGPGPPSGHAGHRDHVRQHGDLRDSQPQLALLLEPVLGRLGVPGRVRYPVLRALRAGDGARGDRGVPDAGAGSHGRLLDAVRRHPPPLVRPAGRRRRDALGLSPDRQRQDGRGGALRRHLGSRAPDASWPTSSPTAATRRCSTATTCSPASMSTGCTSSWIAGSIRTARKVMSL